MKLSHSFENNLFRVFELDCSSNLFFNLIHDGDNLVKTKGTD